MHSRVGNLLWADCRKLVSPPLSPPAHPWPSAGRGAGRAAASVFPPCTPACWRPCPSAPQGAPHTSLRSSSSYISIFVGCSLLWADCRKLVSPHLLFPCSSLALPLLFPCSSLALPLLFHCRKLVSPPLSPPCPTQREAAGVRVWPLFPAATLLPLRPLAPRQPPRGLPLRQSRHEEICSRRCRLHISSCRHSRIGFLLWLEAGS